MKLTVLDQYGKGLVHCDAVLGEEIREKLERLKWSLWHGNLSKALYKIDDIEQYLRQTGDEVGPRHSMPQ